MIYDVLETFKAKYDKEGDKLILGNYTLKDGLYIKVRDNENIEYFVSKTLKRERIFSKINGDIDNKAHDWFKERDYYSGYLNSNKAFSDKKIHNVNYLSFFVKIESFDEKSDKRLDENAIKEQYAALCNYKKFKKPKEKNTLKQLGDSNKQR